MEKKNVQMSRRKKEEKKCSRQTSEVNPSIQILEDPSATFSLIFRLVSFD